MFVARVSLAAVVAGSAGCGLVFQLEHVAPPPPRAIPHVPDDVAKPGTGELALADLEIDTSAAMPVVPLEVVNQTATEADAPEVALLRADTVLIGGELRVVGSRPLVIVARTIAVAGLLDVSADGAIAGPGGGLGPGNGGDGQFATVNEGGGAGGGFDQGAGDGGTVVGTTTNCTEPGEARGGRAGPLIGDRALTVLRGGGSGGAGHADVGCLVPLGGGGGGAVQLSATESIVVTGAIDAGGGGGTGGPACAGLYAAGSGGGGGAGGAIYLDAPLITVDGVLAASGGGGGGGACGGGPNSNGMKAAAGNGADADAAMTAAASGGLAGYSTTCVGAAQGGYGAFGSALANSGQSNDCGNGGGGGGAVGRIVLRGAAAVTGTISPAPEELAY